MNSQFLPKNPSSAGGVSTSGFSSDELWARLVKAWAGLAVGGQEEVLRAAVSLTPGDPVLDGVKIDGDLLLELVDELGVRRGKRRLDS